MSDTYMEKRLQKSVAAGSFLLICFLFFYFSRFLATHDILSVVSFIGITADGERYDWSADFDIVVQ